MTIERRAGEDTAYLAVIDAYAAEIAREAGELLQQRFAGPLAVRFKSKRQRDPVTEADEAAEAFVREAVARRFPDHGFIGEEGEEGGDRGATGSFLWVVDPLDGTANFANGLPIFAVSIGVLRDGAPAAAALYTSFGPDGRPCVLHARRGGGLHRDGKPYTPAPRLSSGRARLAGVSAGFYLGFRYRFFAVPPGETRSLGSIAVEIGHVATGALQYTIFRSPKIWDIAAGVLLVQEAGGAVYTDRNGRWLKLDRFEPAPGKTLRDWTQAVVAGDARLLDRELGRLRVTHGPLEIAERTLGRRRVARLQRQLQQAAALASRLASAVGGTRGRRTG